MILENPLYIIVAEDVPCMGYLVINDWLMLQERRLDEGGDELFRDEVLQYSISQVNGELTWIDKLMHSVT